MMADVSPAGIRLPLQARTNSPDSSFKITTQTKKPRTHAIRRTESFIRGPVDSSESFPSSQDSIYLAHYSSKSASGESDQQGPPHLSAIGPSISEQENAIIGLDTLLENNPIRYGYGTVLTTITEQKSCTTMRSSMKTRSIDGLSAAAVSLLSRSSQDSKDLLKNKARRKQSFSLDDLAFIKASYHEACRNIVECTGVDSPDPGSIHEVYASPRRPDFAPPARPSTPPGMPSWNSAQVSRPRASSLSTAPAIATNRLSRWLLRDNTEQSTHSTRIPVIATGARSQRTNSNMPAYRAPRFRGVRSAYGTLDGHPFNHAPVATSDAVTGNYCTGTKASIGVGNELAARPAIGVSPSQLRSSRIPLPQGHTSRHSRLQSQRVHISPSAHGDAIDSRTMQNVLATNATDDRTTTPDGLEYLCPHKRAKAIVAARARNLNVPGSSPPSNRYHPLGVSSSPFRSSNGAIVNNQQPPTPKAVGCLPGACIPFPSRSELEEREYKCWRCHLSTSFSELNHLWGHSIGVLCITCDGYDDEVVDEPERTNDSAPFTAAATESPGSQPRKAYATRPMRQPMMLIGSFDGDGAAQTSYTRDCNMKGPKRILTQVWGSSGTVGG